MEGIWHLWGLLFLSYIIWSVSHPLKAIPLKHKCDTLSLTSAKGGYKQCWHPFWNASHLQIPGFQVCHYFWIILCDCSGSDSASCQHSQDMDQTAWHFWGWVQYLWPSRLLHKCFLVVFDLTFELWVLFSSSYQRTAEIHLPLVVREVTSGLVFRLVFPFSSRSQQPHPSKAMLGISWFSRFPVC